MVLGIRGKLQQKLTLGSIQLGHQTNPADRTPVCCCEIRRDSVQRLLNRPTFEEIGRLYAKALGVQFD